jgi:hypothetical protein
MHLVVFNELNRMRAQKQPEIIAITPEKTVLLEKNGMERQGRFDFLVRTSGKAIGVEVLSRPSHGKLRQKLAYSREVDEFIFAIPADSMEFYRKRKLNGFKRVAHKKFLGREFSDPKLKVWLVDCRQGMVTEKASFSKIFEVR